MSYLNDDEATYLNKANPNHQIREALQIWKLNSGNATLRFQYAILLSSSGNSKDLGNAIYHFEELVLIPSFRRDCLFSLATCHYRLNNFDCALLYCEELYRDEPDNMQVKRLHSEIVKRNKLNDQQNRDRNENIGVAFGIGALVAVGVGIALSLRKK